MSSNTLKECEPGFMGPDCTYTCRYPSYGTDCYMICGCFKELCDFQYGCISQSKESKYFMTRNHWIFKKRKYEFHNWRRFTK